MTSSYDPRETTPFSLEAPREQTLPYVLNSPHSGRIYPAEFLNQTKLTATGIRKSEDFLVDRLILGAVELGMPLLSASFPRAFIDINREPFELDPDMFDGPLPDHTNSASTRVAGGLGTIARIVAEGEDIYIGQLSPEDALQRIETIYKPYHNALRQLLAQTHLKFGYAVLLDFHSMPSMSQGLSGNRRPDFVLGDRYATSCHPQVTRSAKQLLEEQGFKVAVNKPYAGGFITEHYGRPHNGLHALQIEINRSLYMNEVTIEPSKGFDDFAAELVRFLSRMVELDCNDLAGSFPLAAE